MLRLFLSVYTSFQYVRNVSMVVSTVESNRDRDREICWDLPKFPGLDWFLNLDREIKFWTLMSRLNREISISIEMSWLSRLAFWKCWEIYWLLRPTFWIVEIESLDREHVETNRDHQALRSVNVRNCFCYLVRDLWTFSVTLKKSEDT